MRVGKCGATEEKKAQLSATQCIDCKLAGVFDQSLLSLLRVHWRSGATAILPTAAIEQDGALFGQIGRVCVECCGSSTLDLFALFCLLQNGLDFGLLLLIGPARFSRVSNQLVYAGA